MPENEETTPRRRSNGRRILANLGWVLGGALLSLLLVADPLDLHPVDTWMHDVLQHRHRNGPSAGGGGDAATAEGQLWTCGMHPQVISEEPGPCPICGMDLVPLGMNEPGHDHAVAAAEAADVTWTCEEHPEIQELQPGECPIDGRPLVPRRPSTVASGEREILFYRNPMDPTVTSPVPAKDSMGMDYAPVYADQVAQGASQGPTVTIDPAVVQNMNVQTAVVERRDLSKPIRTVGYLDYDQQQMVSVTTKYSGFIEKVYVNYVGEPVRRGQPLFEIYSPELVQTQEELLSALSFASRLEGAADASRRAEALAEAARTRLSYWDISPAQIDRLEETGQAVRTLTVSAPASGVVMMRMPGMEGMGVKPGMELFHIADLSSLWLSVEIYEDQLPWLREGSEAEITLSYFPGETFRGRVRFVEPSVQEKTRTVGLRVEIPNPGGKLVAGMYATVRFEPQAAKDAVAVPRQAVIRSGRRNLVIVALGEGRFSPREVTLGAEGDDFVQVLAGVEPGESIVTSSQFLIDSESNLREAIQKLISSREGAGDPAPAPASDPAGHR